MRLAAQVIEARKKKALATLGSAGGATRKQMQDASGMDLSGAKAFIAQLLEVQEIRVIGWVDRVANGRRNGFDPVYHRSPGPHAPRPAAKTPQQIARDWYVRYREKNGHCVGPQVRKVAVVQPFTALPSLTCWVGGVPQLVELSK